MVDNKRLSPCSSCIRISDPDACEDKQCRPWRRWFLARWAEIHALAPAAPEHRSAAEDPCAGCICAGDMCMVICPKKRQWLEENGGVNGELEGCSN